MRSRSTAALARPLVALVALGALGAYTSLRHLGGISPRLQAIIFAGIALLGAALVLAGASRTGSARRAQPSSLGQFAKRADEFASVEVPSAVRLALEARPGSLPPEAPRFDPGRGATEELAGLASSIEALGATAVALAAGQGNLRANLAEAFVNLGRRNQNLVTRQLEYISELEQNEADPEALDELFRLDHLATRMRRNAESLLVLAGASPARQWDTPVPAMDIARAASAEVEDYKRLRLHHFDPALVSGSATTDLVHILAELTENSLTYSPPGSQVDIYGRFLEGGYVIVIVDAGIGMSGEDLATANRRLRGEGAEGEVPGRFLGHFVAGMLAARHGVSVSLQPSQAGGLVARVKIPSALLQEPPGELPGAPTSRPLSETDLRFADIATLGSEPTSYGEPTGEDEVEVAAGEEQAPVEAFGRTWDPITALLESSRAEAPAPEGRPAAPGGPPAGGELAGLGEPQADPPVALGADGTSSSLATYLPRHASPDLNYLSPLAGLAARRPQSRNRAVASSPEEPSPPLGQPQRAPARSKAEGDLHSGAHPALQARTTADALRRLTKRVPGAALGEEDSSLRRSSPAGTSVDSAALPSALSQYLSATAADSHRNGTEHEHP
jgi:signal transduction histidine kinase